MSQRPQIRIVKRGRQAEGPKPAAAVPAAREKDSRRTVAENVSAWVEEFQERRTADAGRTFASLFAERAAAANSPA